MNKTDKVELILKSDFSEGWALEYINQERSIPESWRDKFYDELTSKDKEYRTELEQAVRINGVRWVNFKSFL